MLIRSAKTMAVGAVSLIALGGVSAFGLAQGSGAAERGSARLGPGEGAAFAMTNRSTGNEIVTYWRAADGTLTRTGRVSTRGLGIGTDLDTQGPLQLSADHRHLYAVNAGSDNISVFAVRGTHLRFVQTVYAGDEPNSLTIHGNLLYALNGSVAGNGIRSFTVATDGSLTPLAESVRLLSSPIAVPGQVQFSPNGRLLLVTQKTTNEELSPERAIDAFRIGDNGLASALPMRDASYGVRPFSLAFRGTASCSLPSPSTQPLKKPPSPHMRCLRAGLWALSAGRFPTSRQTRAGSSSPRMRDMRTLRTSAAALFPAIASAPMAR